MGISLINIAAKIFASILLNRVYEERNKRTRPTQAGFRKGKGCVDQLFSLRRTLEHRHKYKQTTVACFIDFRSAFDSVNRNALWQLLIADGVPTKIVNLIKAYYASTKARVLVGSESTRDFDLTSGVRQGCVLSPMLFNVAIDYIMRHSLRGYEGVEISQGYSIGDLEYADDIVILGKGIEAVQGALTRIQKFAKDIGLAINADKTKYFTDGLESEQELTINGSPLDRVEN